MAVQESEQIQTKDSSLNYTQQHQQLSVQMELTDRDTGHDDEIQAVLRNRAQEGRDGREGREVSRSSATTEQESHAAQQH